MLDAASYANLGRLNTAFVAHTSSRRVHYEGALNMPNWQSQLWPRRGRADGQGPPAYLGLSSVVESRFAAPFPGACAQQPG
jgi:hypothetical protein